MDGKKSDKIFLRFLPVLVPFPPYLQRSKKVCADYRDCPYYPMNHYNSLEENMRKKMFAWLIMLIFGVVYVAYAQSRSGANAAGTWSGTWTGKSKGKFEMTIKRDAAGKLSGTLTASPDQGQGYTTQFKSIQARASKLTLKFEDPGGEAEATLQAVIAGSAIKGDYSIRSKASGEEVEKGTFTAGRK